MYLWVAPTLAAACSLNRSLFATNVYNLTLLYHIICIEKTNERELALVSTCLVTGPAAKNGPSLCSTFID